MKGVIKKVTRDREYGFIRAEDGVDYFFPKTELRGTPGTLREGLPVLFDPAVADSGPRATDVRPT